MTELQEKACSIMNEIISIAVKECQKHPPGELDFQEEITKAFNSILDNPFKTQDELSVVFTEAVVASGKEMRERIKELMAMEKK